MDKKTPGSKGKRLLILFLVVVLVLAASLLGLVWKNNRALTPLIGVWYSEDEDLQYRFFQDHTYTVFDGQQNLVEGRWRARLAGRKLLLRYQSSEAVRKIPILYNFSEDQERLVFKLKNGRQLPLTRLADLE